MNQTILPDGHTGKGKNRMKEKRHFTRIHFDAIATLKTNGALWDTQIIDISLKGALVRLPENSNLEPNSEAELSLTLSDDATHITMVGRITHIEKEHAGMVCTHIDVDSASHLRRIVELNTGEESLLERELEALTHFHGNKK